MTNAIIWMGSLFDEDEALHARAASIAANNWQLNFIKALIANGRDVQVLNHSPEPIWPKGKLVVTSRFESETIPCLNTSYLNVVRLKRRSIASSLIRKLEAIDLGQYYCVIVYNYAQFYDEAIGHIRRRCPSLPIYYIVADIDRRAWQRELHSFNRATGCIVLSWALFQTLGVRRKYHFDGGVYGRPQFPCREAISGPHDAKRLVYSGALGAHGGVGLLVDSMKHIPSRYAVELQIVGKHLPSELRRQISADPRITYLGALPQDQLGRVCSEAFAFINPRPSAFGNNEYNFPSKLLEYIAYCKPIISFRNPALSPEYDGVLDFTSAETPQSLAEKSIELLNCDAGSYGVRTEKLQQLRSAKDWNTQVRTLAKTFLEYDILGGTLP